MNPNATVSKTRKGNTRVTGKEQYYTPPELASRLVESVAKVVGDFDKRVVVEPAGGTGSFVEASERLGATVLSLDIEPKHPRVKLGNFLTTELNAHRAITISNPPFGRNNSLSIPFFNKAAEFSDYIAFIVPKSWRKWSVQNRLDRNFHLIKDEDLTLNYVDASGTELSDRRLLATSFQIWQRKDSLRELVHVEDLGLIKKCSPEDADVALTLFGFGCGTVLTEFERKPNTTRMFLKLQHPKALKALQSVDFSRFSKNTAYTPALSLPEINYLLNEHIFGDPKLVREN